MRPYLEKHNMLIINDKTIAELSNPVELTDVMEEAMKVYGAGDFVMPARSHMDFNGNTLLSMPSSHGNFFSTKLVSLFPDNPKKGHPVLYGTVILNDGQSGKPLALLNGAKLTAVRTAAVGSAGVRYISPTNASTLGVIGAGVQGLHQAWFACKNRPIKSILIFDAYTELLKPLSENLKKLLPDVEVRIAKSKEECCDNSEIIITATNSTSPVLPNNADLLLGKSIIAIGSYKPDMIELPKALFPLLDHYFIDVDMAVEESGDLIHPINNGWFEKENIHLLSEAMTGKIKINPDKTNLYKSVGMALFDLFAAQFIFEKAKKSGKGELVNF